MIRPLLVNVIYQLNCVTRKKYDLRQITRLITTDEKCLRF